MMFQRGIKTNLITLRERSSRYVIAIKNPSKSSKAVLQSIQEYFRYENILPFKSITFDNDTEFADHLDIANFLNYSTTYFCDPYKSYQKDSIECQYVFKRIFSSKLCD